MEYESELVTMSTGKAGEKLGVSTKTIFNNRERFGMWSRQEEGKYFRAAAPELAELLAMEKLGDLGLPGAKAARLAKYCARGAAFFALRHPDAWVNAEGVSMKGGWDRFVAAILAEHFPDDPTLGMVCEDGKPTKAARWLLITPDDESAADDEDLLAGLNAVGGAAIILIDLAELGAELVRRVGALARLKDAE